MCKQAEKFPPHRNCSHLYSKERLFQELPALDEESTVGMEFRWESPDPRRGNPPKEWNSARNDRLLDKESS
jgi:hypothetical protein